jgi:thiosulfate dehydrogenase
MSLVVVGTLSLIGAVRHWRAGRVDPRAAAIMGGLAIPASYLAARLAVYLSGTVQLAMLAVVICVAAGSMLRPSPHEPAPGSIRHIPLVPAALGVGTLTGLIGVGGGFLIVPTLVLFGGVPMKVAVGTSLLVIAVNCAAGFAGYVGHETIPWLAVGQFTAVAAIGIFVGAYLCERISPQRLRRAFALLLLGVGIAMFAKGRNTARAAVLPKSVAVDTVDPSHIPPDSAIPKDSLSLLRGLALVTHTSDSLPRNTPTNLRCTSCHLDGGRRAGVASLLGAYARYPRYVARAARESSIEERVNFCMTRSMSGRAIAADSREMRDIVRYLAYLSTGVSHADWVRGEGLPEIASLTGDSARGAGTFAATCARCHGAGGEGTAVAPALWGPHSFDIGASMARVPVAASFIRRAMPYDNPGSLTDQQAYDVAAFVTSHARPDFPGKTDDWPKGDAPADVPYITKGHVPNRSTPPLLPHIDE